MIGEGATAKSGLAADGSPADDRLLVVESKVTIARVKLPRTLVLIVANSGVYPSGFALVQ